MNCIDKHQRARFVREFLISPLVNGSTALDA